METSPTGVVSLIWNTRPGSLYRVQSSPSLLSASWSDVATFYGGGQDFSMAVAQVDVNQGGGPPQPPPATSVVSAYFVLSPFAENGKTLVAWREDDTPVRALVDLDFSDLDQLPFLVTDITGAGGQEYSLTFTRAFLQWSPTLATDYPPANLTAPQAARLAILTANNAAIHAAIHAAMLAQIADPGASGTAQTPPAGGAGAHAFYRIVRLETDSDGDGVPDYLEHLAVMSPFAADSDFDGHSDEEELAYGSDPLDAGSVPGDASAPPVPGVDTDGDGLDDSFDFDPLDPNINWEKTAPPTYVPIPIPGSEGYLPVAVNNVGQSLLQGQSGEGTVVWTPGVNGFEVIKKPAGKFTFTIKSAIPPGDDILVELDPVGAVGLDINDEGVIAGKVIYSNVGGGTGSTGGAGYLLEVAARWLTPESLPQHVHPGKAPGATANGSDLLLNSSALRINNEGEIVGEAAVVLNQNASLPVPTNWAPGVTNSSGATQYTPESPAPEDGYPRIHNVSEADANIAMFNLPNTQFIGRTKTGIAAIWNEWGEHPTWTFPLAGNDTLEAAVMPNATRAVLATERLILTDPEAILWAPAVRRLKGALHVTERGTVFRSNDVSTVQTVHEYWHAARIYPLEITLPGLTLEVTVLGDVSSEGVVLARGDNALSHVLAPVQLQQIDYPLAGGIRFCRWTSAFPAGTFDSGFIANDADRFRIRLPAHIPALTKITIESSGIPGAMKDGAFVPGITSDGGHEVEMAEELGAMVSKPLILVTDGDDDHQFNGRAADNSLTADDALNDQTLLAGFDSEITVTFPELDNLVVAFRAQKPVAEITLKPIYCSTDSVMPLGMQLFVDRQIEMMRGIYRQVGIRVKDVPLVQAAFPAEWFSEAEGADGPYQYLNAARTQDLLDVIEAVPAAGQEIRVGFINASLSSKKEDGTEFSVWGIANGIGLFPGKTGTVCAVAMDADGRLQLSTTAHEVGHVLGMFHTTEHDPNHGHWLMTTDWTPPWVNTYTASKRFEWLPPAKFIPLSPFYVPLH